MLEFVAGVAFFGLGIAGAAGLLRLILTVRSRAMQSFAVRRSFRYVGPARPKFGFLGSMPNIRPHLPIANIPERPRQVWNVIEAEYGGKDLLIFDGMVGVSQYCTYIAAYIGQNPSQGAPERTYALQKHRISHSGGWTVLYRVPVLSKNPFKTWSISVRDLESLLDGAA